MPGVRRCLTLALLAALIAGPAARADGDPASDVLLSQRVFLPYQPAVSKPVVAQIERAGAEIAATNRPVRVAVIYSRADLGAVPDFFGKPVQYAKFLAAELALGYRGGLVVVMAQGLGTHALTPAAVRSLRGLKVDPSGGPDGLARAGVFALQRIAKAQGRPIPTVIAESPGGTSSALVGALAVAALAVLAGAVVSLRRLRAGRPASAPS
jgi:hypothetical protein